MKNNFKKNFAYIDGANLHKGIKDFGWRLDYKRFRVWLKEKYSVECAYLFIGLIPKYKDLYAFLQKSGFTLIFKETTYDGNGRVKGNCDADLVLAAVRDTFENSYFKSVLVSSDGDYAGLVKFLLEKNKFKILLSPDEHCSVLLKRTNAPISYLSDKRNILENIDRLYKKAPDADKTA
ncbi:MAG: NYN domain-containing protein [Candidatus Falkowbacteria bacterium]|nr:NYN domain-containing protein [Candidatus Falkowbacteria bacterium]